MIDRKKLYNALRIMGKKWVYMPYKLDWTSDHPADGYCYVIAEVIYHYLAPEGCRPYVMHIDENQTHWFLKYPNGKVIDLTVDNNSDEVNYSQGKPHSFRTKGISKRGKILADLLGLTKMVR